MYEFGEMGSNLVKNLLKTKNSILAEMEAKNSVFPLPDFEQSGPGMRPDVKQMDYNGAGGFGLNPQTKQLLNTLDMLHFKFEDFLYFDESQKEIKSIQNEEEIDLGGLSDEDEDQDIDGNEEEVEVWEIAKKLKTS